MLAKAPSPVGASSRMRAMAEDLPHPSSPTTAILLVLAPGDTSSLRLSSMAMDALLELFG